jgi:hypothetical protein
MEELLRSLEKARDLQRNRRKYGINYVYLYFEDIEGDWLEKWGEEE